MSAWSEIAKYIPMMCATILGISLFGVINNVIASITGTSPTSNIASTLIRDIMPIMIQMMPFMMIISMMRSMFMGFGMFYF